MGQPLNGPGIGLPLPQNLYPSAVLNNAPYDFATNYVTLNAGDTLVIPAGDFYITLGNLCVLQFLDPVNNTGNSATSNWRLYPGGDRPGLIFVKSDGFNLRLANLTGCPVAAIVQNGGTGYVQASTTITATTGGSTWQPIVGGQLSVVSIGNAGANYGKPPILFIPAPPSALANGVGGIQATGYATLTGTTVSSVSLSNFGAGYSSVPTGVLLPDPTDPNFGSITQASVTFGVKTATATVITGALCTNSGAPLATLSALTLTPAGTGGSGAVITPVIMQTVTLASVVAVGAAMGNAAVPCGVMSVGGVPTSVSAIGNAVVELTGFRPRPYIGSGACNAGGSIGTLTTIDSGLFAFTPTAVLMPGAIGATVGTLGASIAFTMGSATDTVIIQPAP